MLILALDTTTRAGSAALVRDGAVVREQTGDPSLTHGQRLPTDLMRLLDAASVRLGDVDLFAVAAGPGSFTGLRVGIATIQGLALARASASSTETGTTRWRARRSDTILATRRTSRRGWMHSAARCSPRCTIRHH